MSQHFVIPLGPQEIARTHHHDPTNAILDALDGVEPDDDDSTPLTLSALEPFFDRLPPFEGDLVSMTLLGKRQVDIASILGITQAGISYRLSRAVERLRFFAELPDLTTDEIREVLEPLMHPFRVEVMIGMWTTSCQTEVADNLGFSQGRVRFHFLEGIRLLEKLARSNPFYKPYAKGFRMVQQNFNIMKEVQMSHWMERRTMYECL